MHRLLACVLLVSCAAPAQQKDVRSTVTVRWSQHVVLSLAEPGRDQVWACSNACHELSCVAACPTALVRGGECQLEERAPGLYCRTFYDNQTYERSGGCQDGEVGAVRRTACVETRSPTRSPVDRVASRVLASLLLVSLMLLMYGAAAGNRT